MATQSPVLLLIFNRPDLTLQVFDAIKKAKPSQLFIAADGPRNEKEKILCEETRRVVEVIDWECKVHRLYRENNLGCKVAVSEAITWFFDNVEEGIILEDDCLPIVDFFTFCDTMLNQYRNNPQVGHISGASFIASKPSSEYNHYLSSLGYIWGWACWKKTWDKYEIDPLANEFVEWSSLPGNFFQKMYWYNNLAQIHLGKLNTWDFQLQYCLWKNKFKSVVCVNNLVKNIGFDERATHTTQAIEKYIVDTTPIENLSYKAMPEEIAQEMVHQAMQSLFSRNKVIVTLKFFKNKLSIWKLKLFQTDNAKV